MVECFFNYKKEQTDNGSQMRPMILSEDEKELYRKTLEKEKGIQQKKTTEEREEKIKEMAKNKARPLKDKIKKGINFLSRIKFREI